MTDRERKSLEDSNHRIGDYADFLGLTDEERRMVELRLALRHAIIAARKRQKLTQSELAKRMKSSQSRVNKLESGDASASLDLLFRGFFAAGGSIAEILETLQRCEPGERQDKSKVRQKRKLAKATT
jgi:predicted XRE-type DNA-binding protein